MDFRVPGSFSVYFAYWPGINVMETFIKWLRIFDDFKGKGKGHGSVVQRGKVLQGLKRQGSSKFKGARFLKVQRFKGSKAPQGSSKFNVQNSKRQGSKVHGSSRFKVPQGSS